MANPTNRSFFGSFLSAFRVHGASLSKAAAASSPTVTTSPAQATSFSTQATTSTSNTTNSANTLTSPTQAKTITRTGPSVGAGATSVAIQASHFHTSRQYSTSPYSPTSTSPGTGALTPLQSRGRRGSDSSSEGFRESSMGAEKWYIGGRTAGGEDKVYKLSMVKRPRSIDRISLDRMSL